MLEENLSQFGLRKNHIRVIKFLLDNPEKEFTAKDISHEVKIPISRIYQYINYLIKRGLINKNVGSTLKYSIKDPQIQFSQFFAIKRDLLNQIEKQFYDSLKYRGSKYIYVPLHSREDFFRELYNSVTKSKTIKIISKRLTFFSGEEIIDSWEEEVKKTVLNLTRKGVEFYYIFDESLKQDRINELKKSDLKVLKKLCKLPNFHFRVINSSYGTSFGITDKDVLLAFRNAKTKKVDRGLLARSPEMVDFMNEVFDDLFRQGRKID